MQKRTYTLQQFLRSDWVHPGMWLFAVIMLVVAPVLILRNMVFGRPADTTANFFPDIPWDEDEEAV